MFRTLLSLTAAACFAALAPATLSAQAHAQAPSPAPRAAAPGVSSKAARRSSKAKPPVTGTININTASATELQALPGIGATTADRIVEYRQKNGPFKKIEDLMNVRGVGEKAFLKLKPNLTVGAKADRAAQQQ